MRAAKWFRIALVGCIGWLGGTTAGCGGGAGGSTEDGGEGESEAESESEGEGYQIALVSLPPAGTLVRAPFAVGIEIRSADGGEPVAPAAPLAVTLERAAGAGTLSGTLTAEVASATAVFEGLSYDALDALEIRATSARAASAQSEPIPFDVDIAADPEDLGSVLSGETIPEVEFTLIDGLGDPYPVDGTLEWSLVDGGTSAEVASGTVPLGGGATAAVALSPIDAIAAYRLDARLSGSAHAAAVDLDVLGYDLVFTSQPPDGTLVNAPFAVDLEIRDPRTSLPVAPPAPLLVTLSATAGAGTLGGTLVQAVSTPNATFPGLSYDRVDSLAIQAASPRSLPASSGPIAFEVAIAADPADLGEIRPGAAILAVSFSLLDGLSAPYATTADLEWTLVDQTTGLAVTTGTQSFAGAAMADVVLSPIFLEASYRLRGNLAGSANDAFADFEVEGYDLAFMSLPPSGTLVNAPFSVDVEVRDKDTGNPVAPDAPLQVTLNLASGAGTLSGTLSQLVATPAANFTGVSYDTIDTATIQAISLQSQAEVSPPITFDVDVEATPSSLGSILPGSTIPPVTFTLTDGLGLPYPVSGTLSWTLVDQNTMATYRTGSEDFAGTADATVNLAPIPDEAPYALTGNLAGSANQATVTLVVTSLTLENEPGPFVALKSARVGDVYYDDVSFAVAGAFEWGLLSGSLPDGLSLDPATGEITGSPTAPTNGKFTLYAKTTATMATPIRCALAVFSTDETEWVAGQSFIPDGPTAIVTTTDATTFTSSFDGANYTTSLRIYHPNLATVTTPLPLFVFHRGRGFNHLDYDLFLTHVASYGFICVSVEDCESFVEGTPQGCAPLAQYDLIRADEGMESGSAFHEAAIERMRARNTTMGDPFEGKVDETAVIVGGHSRGGGANHGSHVRGLDLQINGAIYFMAYDLRNFAETEPPGVPNAYAIPDVQPRLPSLIIAAENDGDIRYPIGDQFIDRASGQATSVTLYGGNHNRLGDTNADELPLGGAPYITRDQEQDFISNQVIAFLKRWGTFDLGLEGFLYGNEHAGSTDYGVAALRNMTDVLWVDDYQDGNAASNLLGGANSLTGGSRQELPIYPDTGNMPSLGIRHNLLTFSANTSTYGTQLPGGIDVSALKRVVFRCGQTSTTGYDWVTFGIRLSDGSTNAAVTLFDRNAPDTTYLPDFSGDARVYDRFVQVEVTLDEFVAAAPALDLGALTSVELTFSFAGTPSAAQQIYVDDLRFE
jgi:hypothetical protein